MTSPPFPPIGFDPVYPVPDFATLYPNTIGDELFEFFRPLVDQWGDPNDHLWIFTHAIGMMFKPIDDLVNDGPNGEPGPSQILDLTRAKTEWLPWLGQWAGYVVPAQGTQDLNSYDSIVRRQIVCMAAHRRGSIEALYDAVEYHLNPPQVIIIHERTPDTDHMDLFVMANQVRTSQALLTQAAQAAKAAGLLLNITFVVAGTYNDLKAHNVTYNVMKTKFSSYNDMSLNASR